MRPVMYELHEALEERHWWFTARRSIVLTLLRSELRRIRLQPPLRILDVGCGTGGTLRHLAEFGTVAGVDPEPSAVQYAARKGDVDVQLGGLPEALPFGPDSPFDVITMLDVLEHIEDDAGSLRTLHSLLRPGGLMIVTVPAFPFLWSAHDVVNEHKRRYTRSELRAKLLASGFDISVISYYNTMLFVPVALVRLLRRWSRTESEAGDLGVVGEPFNAVLHTLFAVERHVLTRVSLPFGVSLIALVRKPQDGPQTQTFANT